MPVPLVPAIAFAVVAAAGIVAHAVSVELKGHPLAILGRSGVGKSTLLRELQERGSTGDVESGGASPFFLSDKGSGRRLKLHVRSDLPGSNGLGHAAWKSQVLASDFVYYMFRADLIAHGDKDEVQRVREHLDMLKTWMTTMGKPKSQPKVILIGTWADEHEAFRHGHAAFKELVRSAAPLKLGAVMLNHAPVLVGSLKTEGDVARMVKSLRETHKRLT
jgi:hypothetical protein